MRKIHFYYVMVGIALLGFVWPNMPSTSSTMGTTPKWASEFRPYGAYIDEIHFEIFPAEDIDLAMLALQEGEIDAYDGRVLQDYLAGFVRDPNITVTFTPSANYRSLNLDCYRYPTNITAFRRAMAYGFDKYQAAIGCVGCTGFPQDSYIPISNTEWEVESETTDHFYEADFVSGNKSLENGGFKDLDGDGWREYDKNKNDLWDPGVDLDDDAFAEYFQWENKNLGILELFVNGYSESAVHACNVMVDGLRRMGIRSETVELDWLALGLPSEWELWSEKRSWGLWWTECIPIINTPEFLYYNFRTSADPWRYYSYFHFSNNTIDTVLDQMVEATTLEDVKEYAREANRLLTFEQPQIVCYHLENINAYRTNKFEGYLEFVGLGTASGENMYLGTKVHLKEANGGPYGGIFRYCLSGNMSNLNPFFQQRSYEETVLQYIFERLWNIDPKTWDPIPGLAYDWEIESTTANGEIRDGQKFTFFLYKNETWHDGEPFTAADVNHSFHLWRSSPRCGPEMEDIYKVAMPEGPEGHIIEFYVNETGYFEWADTTRFYITPEHIWRDVTNVSTFTPTNDQIIGTGPYKWNEYLPGESISLRRHEDWRWDIRDVPIPPPSSSEGGVSTQVTTSHQSSLSEDTPGFTLFILIVVSLSILVMKRLKRNIRT
ncbi:MAG: ABC transporter substrate-binding protein [Promethearchaeota archaeon]